MELKQGSVDAIAADLGVAKFQIASNEGDYVILNEPISTPSDTPSASSRATPSCATP